MKVTHILAAVVLANAFVVSAQTAPASNPERSAHHPRSAAAPRTDGEVRKIDKELGKLTLRHGPMPNLDMPAMTMIFRMADPKQLEGLKEGDKVKFDAEKVNGAFTVTTIQVVP
jgi:Cu(I)/Ag(I) efflux system protein CusF